MPKKTIRDVDVQGKKVFCRVDFNVPMSGQEITDDTRIRAAIPTIQYLVDKGARVILASHLGRPKGKVVEELRLAPVAEHLSKHLNQEVKKSTEVIGDQVVEQVAKLQPGEILLLENVRFEPGEEKNSPELALQLAALADLFVNDAFGAAHRAHASTEGIGHHIPGVAGFLMEKELAFLGDALANPERPFTAIIGGAKVKDKIGVIESLLEKVDNLIIGGGLANTFIKAQGYDVGASLLEEDKVELAASFIEKAKQRGVNFCIPTDVVVADKFANDANTKVVSVKDIPAGWQALDIGPETVKADQQVIAESKTVVWNGPMGVFEMETFMKGTEAIAQAMVKVQGTTIIGGGDSVAAVEKAGVAENMSHISTGGGASLEFMEGKQLPGVTILQDK